MDPTAHHHPAAPGPAAGPEQHDHFFAALFGARLSDWGVSGTFSETDAVGADTRGEVSHHPSAAAKRAIALETNVKAVQVRRPRPPEGCPPGPQPPADAPEWLDAPSRSTPTIGTGCLAGVAQAGGRAASPASGPNDGPTPHPQGDWAAAGGQPSTLSIHDLWNTAETLVPTGLPPATQWCPPSYTNAQQAYPPLAFPAASPSIQHLGMRGGCPAPRPRARTCVPTHVTADPAVPIAAVPSRPQPQRAYHRDDVPALIPPGPSRRASPPPPPAPPLPIRAHADSAGPPPAPQAPRRRRPPLV